MFRIRIKSLTFTAITLAIGISALFGISLHSTYNDYRDAVIRERFTTSIVAAAFQLTSLAGDYMLYRQPRAQEQWLAIHKSLEERLRTPGFPMTDADREIVSVSHHHRLAGRIFARLSSGSRQVATGEYSATLEKRLMDTLLTATQAMVSQASLLDARSQQVLGQSAKRMIWLIGSIILMFAAMIGGLSFILARRVVPPLQALTTGIQAFSAGDNNHRIVIKNSDEIGEVAAAFNEMAERLKKTLVSRNELAEQIEERERTEQMLQDREKFLSGVMENTSDGLITISETGAIRSFNPGAEKIFGYNTQEVIGKNVSLLMTAQDGRSHDDHLRSYIETGKARVIGKGPRILIGQRKSGAAFPLEIAVGEMQLGSQRLFIGSLRDITDRREHWNCPRNSPSLGDA